MNNENIQQTNSSMSNGMSGRTGTPVVPLPDFRKAALSPLKMGTTMVPPVSR